MILRQVYFHVVAFHDKTLSGYLIPPPGVKSIHIPGDHRTDHISVSAFTFILLIIPSQEIITFAHRIRQAVIRYHILLFIQLDGGYVNAAPCRIQLYHSGT